MISCFTVWILLSFLPISLFAGEKENSVALLPGDIWSRILFFVPLTDQTAFALTDKTNKEFVELDYYICTYQQYFEILTTIFINSDKKRIPKKEYDLLAFIKFRTDTDNVQQNLNDTDIGHDSLISNIKSPRIDRISLQKFDSSIRGEALIIKTDDQLDLLHKYLEKLSDWASGNRPMPQNLNCSPLLKRFNCKVFSRSGENVLFWHPNIDQELFSLSGMKHIINIPNKKGHTALAHFLCGESRYWYYNYSTDMDPANFARIIRLLLDHGAVPDISDPKSTIFHFLCSLLQSKESMPFFTTYYLEHLPENLIQSLVNKTDSHGRISLVYACSIPVDEETRQRQKNKIIVFLLNHNALTSDDPKSTLLHWLAEQIDQDNFDLPWDTIKKLPLGLIKPMINQKDSDGNTPLHIAYMKFNTHNLFPQFSSHAEQLIDFLLKHDVNPEIRNDEGFTVFELAHQGQTISYYDMVATRFHIPDALLALRPRQYPFIAFDQMLQEKSMCNIL